MKKILTLLMGVFALASSVQAQTTFTIVNNNPTEWSQLALYEWHDGGATFGDWPGKVLYDGTNLTSDEQVTVAKSENTFTVTIASGVSFTNLILNNNNHGKQMDLADFGDGKSYEIAAPMVYGTAIYFINSADWAEIHLYNYNGSGEIYGAWPGILLVNSVGAMNPTGSNLLKVTNVGKVAGNHDVYKIELGDGTGFNTFIFNNGSGGGNQSADAAVEDGAYYDCAGRMTNVSITPANQYTTYVAPAPLDFSGLGVKAYKASSANASAVTLTEVTEVPAGTPLILKGEGTFSVPVVASADAIEGNLLQAGGVNIGGSDKYDYILMSDAKFHRVTSESALAAGKAYLHLDSAPASAPSLSIDFADVEVTGISTTLNDNGKMMNDKYIYNLNGQRVVQPTKGLYIINGKKVVLK